MFGCGGAIRQAMIPTGAERAEQERQAKEAAEQRVERLAAQLRALGVNPDELS